MASDIIPKFGEIFYAILKQDGSIQGGRRPVIIAQNDVGNRHSPTVEVIPISAKVAKASYMPTHVIISADETNGLSKDSVAMAEQVRVINKTQLCKRVGSLHHEHLVNIGKARQVQSPFPLG